MSVAATSTANQTIATILREKYPSSEDSSSISHTSNWKVGNDDPISTDSSSGEAIANAEKAAEKMSAPANPNNIVKKMNDVIHSKIQRERLSTDDDTPDADAPHFKSVYVYATMCAVGVIFGGLTSYLTWQSASEREHTNLGFAIASVVLSAAIGVGGAVGVFLNSKKSQ